MKKNKYASIAGYAILSLITISFILPILWLLFASFDANATSILSIPKNFTLDNYTTVLFDSQNVTSSGNSLFISVITTVLVIIISYLAAYPLARFNLKHAQKVSLGLLFFTAIPMTALMIPVYQLFLYLGMIDSMPAVAIFMAATNLPFSIWMMKNFLEGISVDLEEAAWVDGANMFQTSTKIILPLMIPGILTVGIFTFISAWGNFFVPFMLLYAQEKTVVAVNIYQFFDSRGSVVYGQLAAYSIFYMAPVFIFYFFAQNYMSKGFSMSGAAKG